MSIAPYRAVTSIAWRQARRSPWRSALVIATIAVPIAGLSLAAIAIRATVPTMEQRVTGTMGTADMSIAWSKNLSAATVLHAMPTGSKVTESWSTYSQETVDGSFVSLSLDEYSTPLDQPPLRGMFKILTGRAPAAAGEAAVQPEALAAYGLSVGDDLTIGDLGFTVRVTGTIVRPESLADPVVLLGPGTLDPNVRRVHDDGYLVDLPPGVSADVLAASLPRHFVPQYTRASVYLGDPGRLVYTGVSFAMTAVLLMATALIAGAAFVIGARRQLRTLGLIGAAGGEPRHVRATVLMGGVCLGVIGSLAGVVLGIGASLLLRPELERIGQRLVGSVSIPVLPLAGAVALGTLAASIAAFGPARSATRLSTLHALAGRTPPARAPGRLAAFGLVVVLVGAGVTAWATAATSHLWLTAGLTALIGGFLVAIPLVVTFAGRFAGRMPTVPRLAMRDIARHGRRTSAALAAATLALGFPVAISALTLSQQAFDKQVYIGPDQLSIGSDPSLGSQDPALAGDLRAAIPGSIVVPYQVASIASDRGGGHGTRERTADVLGPKQWDASGQGYSQSSVPLAIGGPDLLRVFHVEGGIPALEAGKIVGVGPGAVEGGSVSLVKGSSRPGAGARVDVPAVEGGSTPYVSLGNGTGMEYIASPELAASLGLHIDPDPTWNSTLLLRAPGALDGDQIAKAKEIAARYTGVYVLSAADVGVHTEALRRAVNAIGAVIALAIVGVIVALVAAESQRDQAILVAVGAEPRIRRAVMGTRALVVAVLAGLLAVPAGFAPAAVFRLAQGVGYQIVVPWSAIALVLVGIPLIAGAFGALISRQPKAAQLLRPIA